MVPKKGTLAYRCDVITRTLGASVGAKAAEKISVTCHFVIWSMKVFVSTKFYGMLAFFWGRGWAPIAAKRIQSDPAEVTFRQWFLT